MPCCAARSLDAHGFAGLEMPRQTEDGAGGVIALGGEFHSGKLRRRGEFRNENVAGRFICHYGFLSGA